MLLDVSHVVDAATPATPPDEPLLPDHAAAFLDCKLPLEGTSGFWDVFRRALATGGPLHPETIQLAASKWFEWEQFVEDLESRGLFDGSLVVTLPGLASINGSAVQTRIWVGYTPCSHAQTHVGSPRLHQSDEAIAVPGQVSHWFTADDTWHSILVCRRKRGLVRQALTLDQRARRFLGMSSGFFTGAVRRLLGAEDEVARDAVLAAKEELGKHDASSSDIGYSCIHLGPSGVFRVGHHLFRHGREHQHGERVLRVMGSLLQRKASAVTAPASLASRWLVGTCGSR